jgi:hypothetical protein
MGILRRVAASICFSRSTVLNGGVNGAPSPVKVAVAAKGTAAGRLALFTTLFCNSKTRPN